MTREVTMLHPLPPNEVSPVRTAHVNGVELHYTDTRTDGAPVILLHGGMGDLYSWPHQQRALRVRYRVVSYSRRHSHPNRNAVRPGDRAPGIDDDVDDFLALQATLRLGPSHLVATSYGALLALVIAMRTPAQVASLVLAEPPLHRWASATPAGERLYRDFIHDVWRPAGEAFDAGEARQAMELLTHGMWGRPMLESWPADRVDAAMRNALAMRQLTRMHDPFTSLDRSAIAQLAMPVLLLEGEQTGELHRQVMNELALTLSAARRIKIPDAGHASPHENPRAFTAAAEEFLESLKFTSGVRNE